MTGWVAGLQIRCGDPDRGSIPTADYLCTLCWHHTRLSGYRAVRDGARDLPLSHRAVCPALHPKGTQ